MGNGMKGGGLAGGPSGGGLTEPLALTQTLTSSVASGLFWGKVLAGARISLNSGTDTSFVYYDVATAQGVLNGNWTTIGNMKVTSGDFYANGNSYTSNTNLAVLVKGWIPDGAAAIGTKLGNINALTTAGAKILAFYSDNITTEKLAIGKNGQFIAPTGTADAIVGTAALVAGTVTVSTTSVSAASKIFVTHATPGGTMGHLSQGTIVAGTSFVINSNSGTDTSTVNWWIVN